MKSKGLADTVLLRAYDRVQVLRFFGVLWDHWRCPVALKRLVEVLLGSAFLKVLLSAELEQALAGVPLGH